MLVKAESPVETVAKKIPGDFLELLGFLDCGGLAWLAGVMPVVCQECNGRLMGRARIHNHMQAKTKICKYRVAPFPRGTNGPQAVGNRGPIDVGGEGTVGENWSHAARGHQRAKRDLPAEGGNLFLTLRSGDVFLMDCINSKQYALPCFQYRH